MKTIYDQISSTSASLNENIRFKTTFMKLVDDITNMNQERENSNLMTTNGSKYSSSKINSYKFDMLINREKTNPIRTPGLFSPKTKGNQNIIFFDKMKLDSNLKSKYKNILENGLISIKTGEYDKYEITESKFY